jgi:hypothetical protein
VSSSGLDSVTFLLAAGPSEPLRPLADVASGGEAARVMLALKAAAAAVAADAAAAAGPAPAPGLVATSGPDSSHDEASTSDTAGAGGGAGGVSSGPPPVLVLDELDAGVGSRLGAPIGRLLQTLVAGQAPTASQVLVVTHTPQVGTGSHDTALMDAVAAPCCAPQMLSCHDTAAGYFPSTPIAAADTCSA